MLAIGVVAGDLSPDTIARCAGVLSADGTISPDQALRLVDDLSREVVSNAHARQVTTRSNTLNVVAFCDHMGEVNLSLGGYQSALTLLQSAQDLDLISHDRHRGWRLMRLAMALDGLGDVTGARLLLEQALVRGDRSGDVDLVVEAALYLATDALEAGDRQAYDRALGVAHWVAASDGNPRLVLQADRVCRNLGSPRVLNSRAFFTAQRAVSHDDPEILLRALPDDRSPVLHSPLIRAVVAWCFARVGERDRAEDLVVRALGEIDFEASGLFLLSRLSDAAAALSAHDLCYPLIEQLTPWSTHVAVDSNAWWCDGPVSLWLAVLHHAVGDSDVAGDWMERSRPLVDELGDIRSRRRLHALEEALAGSELRTTGGDLTPREVHMLRLMSTGLSNHDIAQRLGVSHSTIRNASMALYRKLAVTDRAEAVGRAYSLRLITPSDDR